MSERSGNTQSVLSLPKGGSAIKGIGETFQANLFSGTGNHSLPIALSPGRNGFGPKLSLDYSSGNGNGIFGLGWQLSLPRITRKTEKGLPRYDDGDVFVMSGAEDLVRCLKKGVDPETGQSTWVAEHPIVRSEFEVFLYRPRTEGAFARIERWVHQSTGETHWRTITKDNVTSLFGCSAASRLSDPADDRRVYEWLIQETFDAFGNHVLCEYAADAPSLYSDPNSATCLPEIFEKNRVATQRYIRRIYYGNLPEPLVDTQSKPISYPDGAAVGHLRKAAATPSKSCSITATGDRRPSCLIRTRCPTGDRNDSARIPASRLTAIPRRSAKTDSRIFARVLRSGRFGVAAGS